MTKKELQIENRKQRVESLKNDAEIMALVATNIRYDPNMGEIGRILDDRILNNILDRMLILKEIEIISQQP